MQHETFYSTAATVIPVLYISVGLTPAQFENLKSFPTKAEKWFWTGRFEHLKPVPTKAGKWFWPLLAVIATFWAGGSELIALGVLMLNGVSWLNGDGWVWRSLVLSGIVVLLAYAAVQLVRGKTRSW